MRLLTPTENRRLNEMVGFLGITLAILIALALLSYSPHDSSFNVASQALDSRPARNWIGPAGAYGADGLFQLFGYAAFLLPMGICAIGLRWFRSSPLDSALATLIGSAMMILSVPSLLALWGLPDVRGAIPPGGLLGAVMADGLRAWFNSVGAHVVAVAFFLTALFLTTSFSFSGTHAMVRGPLQKLNPIGRLKARWTGWRQAREQARLRQKVESNKTAGRQPVPMQAIAAQISGKLPVNNDDDSHEEERDEDEARREPVLVMPQDAADEEPAAKKRGAEPKISRSKTSFRLPSPGLLRLAERSEKVQEDELKECAHAIEQKCREFDVGGHVTQINPGPVVTTYEFKPEAGIKYSRITGLSDDLCLALKAESILIERIPGKSTVGLEVPNQKRQTIALREVIESQEYVNTTSKLALALGKDLIGRIRVSDLAQMPHLLIAGSTGTGKSVFLNSLIVSMLYKATPDELKLVMIDPKRLELGLYEEIPHLLAPVVTDPKVASNVLRNATREMERRLKLLAQRGVRNIEQYNRTFAKGQSLSLFENVDDEEHKPLPLIVIVIDELADLMMVDTNNVEESITRLAQMARAVKDSA